MMRPPDLRSFAITAANTIRFRSSRRLAAPYYAVSVMKRADHGRDQPNDANMTFETVLYDVTDSVATVTMNRPDALNALSAGLTRDLEAAISRAVRDDARAVILAA